MLNIRDRNAGFAAGQEQVLGFSKATGIDSKSYFAPGSKIFYVDPNNAQATDFGNLGEDPTVPLATVAAAIVLCRDHMGDTIVIGANDAWIHAPHTYRPTIISETIIIPESKGGIRLVGACNNPRGVSWTPADDSEVAITVHAIDVLIEGITFYAPTITNGIGILAEWGGPNDVYGDNLTVRDCVFSAELDYGIQLDFSYYTQIYGNYFDTVTVAAIVNNNTIGDPDYACIYNNTFLNCTDAISLLDTDDCFIFNNRIYGDGTGTDNFIDLTGGGNNLVADNWLACTIGQYDVTCSDAASGAWINNHCLNGDTTANPI